MKHSQCFRLLELSLLVLFTPGLSNTPAARPSTEPMIGSPGADPVGGCSGGAISAKSCRCLTTHRSLLIGVYNADDPADLHRFNRWLGAAADVIQLDGGRSDWGDWQNSLDWLADLFKNEPGAIRWSVPLIPDGATLDEAARGHYDQQYRTLARQFIRHYGVSTPINIRLGWEFNGTGWNPWSAVGKPLEYKKAYREFVAVFRSVGSNFTFEWTPNVGDVGMNPEDAYPGDDVVGLIGMDFYYNIAWDSADPKEAWHHFLNEKYGLQWHQDFAAAHHKPTAYAEWGVNTDAAGPFITLAADWFRSHHVVYQSYWNSNSEFAGRLSDDQYPNAGAAYKAAFTAHHCWAGGNKMTVRTLGR